MRTRIIGCSLLALVVSQADLHAYCLRTASTAAGATTALSWAGPVPYAISDSVSDPTVRAAIDAAFASWAAVSCSTLQFQPAGMFPLAQADYNKPGAGIHVLWYAGATGWPAQPDHAASSLVIIDGQGHVVQAAIAINAFKFAWATDGSASALDVQGELMALIGQVVGLEASNAPASIMQGSLKLGDTSKRTLQPDDEAAVRYLYADPSCATPPAPGPDGCSALAGSGTGGTGSGGSGNTGGAAGNASGSAGAGSGSGGFAAPGCSASTECAAGQVCTAEGTCVPATGQGSGTGCTSFVECAAGEVCTAEGSCVEVGSSPGAGPAPGCSSSAECGEGAVCSAEGTCLPIQSNESPSGAPSSSAGCSGSGQCGAGEVCSAEGVCLAVGGAAGGGGCAVGHGAAGRELPLLPLVALSLSGLLLGSWRRRKRSAPAETTRCVR